MLKVVTMLAELEPKAALVSLLNEQLFKSNNLQSMEEKAAKRLLDSSAMCTFPLFLVNRSLPLFL